MKSHWFRGEDFQRSGRHSHDFDPVVEGGRYGLAPAVSLEIWARVCAEATNSDGVRDEQRARERFHEVAARVAAKNGLLRPDPGRTTLLEAGARGADRERDVFAPLAPGRMTLQEVEARRWERRQADVEPTAVSADAGLPHKGEVAALLGRLSSDAPALAGGSTPTQTLGLPDAENALTAIGTPPVEMAPDRAKLGSGLLPQPQAGRTIVLDSSVGTRISRLFGVDLTWVRVVPNSPAATGSTKAVTRDGEVHFGAGAYRPGTTEGDRLIAHELAHVVQQRGARGGRAGTRKELEHEADRAATFALGGLAAPISLRADPTSAYAFDEDDAHDHDEVADHEGGAAADPRAAAARRANGSDAANTDAEVTTGDPAHQADPHATETTARDEDHGHVGTSQPAGDIAPERTAEQGVAGAREGVAAVLPSDETPGGAAGTGGGAPAKPQKALPNPANATPEVTLAALQGVRPDRIALLFGPMRAAASADVAKARAAHLGKPPKQMSTGELAPPKVATQKDTSLRSADDPKAAKDPKPAKDLKATAAAPEPSVKAEVPGGEAAKQAKQDDAAAQSEAVAQVVAAHKRSIDALFRPWTGRDEKSDEAGAVKMSPSETRQIAQEVDNLPTTAADITAETGPAPELAMKSDAKRSAEKDRAELEETAAALETLGRSDSHAPMGEDHIESTVSAEELTGSPPAANATGIGPAAALPTVAAAATSEEVGIVAQEQHGAEIDAALAKASADVATARGKEAQDEAKARADADTQIGELKAKADADQAAARTAAQTDVHQARTQWQAEIDKHGADARKQGDKKVAEGMAQVEAEEAKANAEAKQHIEEGRRKAEEEKQNGEKEAADAKAKAKSKSSGFWGWVASKAKAVANGVKKAVSAAIDACRRAVKAVIAAAKKLAMAVIDLARKVIVSLIKAVGQALLAITDVLLAAFPALREKFQRAIRTSIDKAVAAVNKFADGLKKAVQKALDGLAAALDTALQLLEKGVHFIIDAASAIVQGAIKAAQAIVEALGTWAKLIKDIASGPGSWIGKLGAAIVDGIKNHLWAAFKTTVVEWFKSKVFELLGIGGIILQVLLDGGLSKDEIIQMALDALIVTIPAALIAILIEKLVSMIVPAAGALMAIIEGLQAAWGTISRIIAAFAAFMAFLLAVKGGAAGALFVGVLAGAAVVVLDFVANWLLKKLASAARKVGAKLKGLAGKFKAKRKVEKDAKTRKHHEHHAGADGVEKPADHRDPKKGDSSEEKRKEEIQKRVDKAQRELPPKLNQLVAKKPSRLRVLAQFAVWRVRYRLSKLELRGTQGKIDIFAQINPLIALAPGWTFKDHDVFKVLDEIGGELLAAARQASPTPKRAATGQLDFTQRTHPSEPAAHLQPGTKWTKTTTPPTPPPPESQYLVGHTEGGTPLGYRHERIFGEVGRIRPLEDGFGSNYQPLLKKLEGVNVGDALGKLVRNERVPNMTKEQSVALSELYGLWIGGKEASHPKGTFGHQRDLTYSYMTGQLMEGGTSLEKGVAMHPASFGGAQKGAGRITLEMHSDEELPPLEDRTKKQKKEKDARNERYDRETQTSQAWFQHHLAALRAWFAQRLKTEQRIEPREPTIDDVKDFVRYQIKLYLYRNPPANE